MWSNDNPGSKVPARVKRLIRQRQHNRCAVFEPAVCIGTLDQFDHVINLKTLGIPRNTPAANDPALFQGLCTPCHRRKSALEGARQRHHGHLRDPQPHPGLVR